MERWYGHKIASSMLAMRGIGCILLLPDVRDPPL